MDNEDLLQFSFLTFVIGLVVLLVVLTVRSAVNFTSTANQSIVDNAAAEQQAIVGQTIANAEDDDKLPPAFASEEEAYSVSPSDKTPTEKE